MTQLLMRGKKRREAEERVEMSVAEYLAMATTRELGQAAMAQALGVSRATVSLWLSQAGYETHVVYRKRRAA